MIEFRNVSFVYGENTPFEHDALKNVSLTIEDNKVTGIIGHTGSGKSTLAQMMNALIAPSEGQVLLDGKNINENKEISYKTRFKVGLVFQYPEYQLFEESVFKDIAFGPKNMGLSDEEIKRRGLEAAEFTGIDGEMLKKSPFELSGGQKRRVAIAGTLAMDPEVLVLDEPASGLDPKGKKEILGGLINYNRKKKNALVIISHSMEDIALYSDKIIALSDGSILTQGSPEEVFSQYDKLKSSGLALPEISELMHILKCRGIDVDTSVFTVEKAFDILCPKLCKRKGTTAKEV